MIRAAVLLMTGFAVCNAETVCPYLNSATAAGILGEKLTVSISPGEHTGDAICEFDGASAALRIEVKTMSNPRADFPAFLARCGSNASSLHGIGNEAVACIVFGKNGEVNNQILSRVRERSILIRVTDKAKHANQASRREQSTEVGEQVAGSLF